MPLEPHDPRDIPILTDAVNESAPASLSDEAKAVHAAILTETLELADSLLHQAVKDIEATLFERVLDRLRSRLPELVDRILREHAAAQHAAAQHAAAQEDPQDHG